MRIEITRKLKNGKGYAINITTKRFRFGFGYGVCKIKPVFYYRFNGYDKVLKKPTILRHLNILRFKNFAVGFSLSFPCLPHRS